MTLGEAAREASHEAMRPLRVADTRPVVHAVAGCHANVDRDVARVDSGAPDVLGADTHANLRASQTGGASEGAAEGGELRA